MSSRSTSSFFFCWTSSPTDRDSSKRLAAMAIPLARANRCPSASPRRATLAAAGGKSDAFSTRWLGRLALNLGDQGACAAGADAAVLVRAPPMAGRREEQIFALRLARCRWRDDPPAPGILIDDGQKTGRIEERPRRSRARIALVSAAHSNDHHRFSSSIVTSRATHAASRLLLVSSAASVSASSPIDAARL